MSFTEFSQLERAFGFGYENHTLWLRSVVSAGSGDRNHEMPVHTRDPLDPRASHWNWLSYYIRWLREKNGLSLAQCGNILGVTRGTVCNFESGYRRLDEHYAKLLDERYDTGDLVRTMVFYACMTHDPNWAATVRGL
jgi:DNA-binding XRE family transcriptional regulator